MDYQYHVYILEDPDDPPTEIQEFITAFFQRFNCHPHNRDRRLNVYLPRNDDIAGMTKFDNVHNAINNSKMILCIISPWNTHWINYCRHASFYQKIVNNKRDMFIPVFLGYSSAAEANIACPEEIRCQTGVMFKASWRDDDDAWGKLDRSLQVPIEAIATGSGSPATRVAIQCTDGFDHSNVNSLSPDGPPFSTPISSPILMNETGLFINGRVETSPSSGRETYTMPAPVIRDHVSQDQILEVLGGPSLLSASRSGGLFQDNPDSSIRHKAPVNIIGSSDERADEENDVGSSDESADEENDDRNFPSEVTVDNDRAGQSHHAEFTDSTNPKLLFDDSLGSDSCTGRETLLGRLPSNVTDDNEDEISVDHDSREFSSGEQSDHNYGMSHLIDSAYSSGDGGQSGNGEQRTGTDELQTGAGELQTGAGELQTEADEVQTGSDMQQKGTDLQQDVEGVQNVLGDSSITSERCGKTVASHDVEDHHPHGPLRDGEASGGEESGTSVLNPAQNAGGYAGIALGRWAARAFAIWELIQYY